LKQFCRNGFLLTRPLRSEYPGTALGALLIGVLESFASFLNSSLKEVVVFSVLIPVLLWRSLSLGRVDEEDAEVEG